MTNFSKRIALAALAAPVVFGLAACDTETANPPLRDVDQGWQCQPDDGLVHATGSVTNHSSKPSFYVVTVSFFADGVEFDHATATADGVAAGATAPVSASTGERPSGDVTCAVTDVERFKA